MDDMMNRTPGTEQGTTPGADRLAELHKAFDEAASVGCVHLVCRLRLHIGAAFLVVGGALVGASVMFGRNGELTAALGTGLAVGGGFVLGAAFGRERRRLRHLLACAKGVTAGMHMVVAQREEMVRDLMGHVERHHAALQQMSEALAGKLGTAWRPARLPDSRN